MKIRIFAWMSLISLAGLTAVAEDSHKLEDIKSAPAELNAKVSQTLSPAGYRIVGPDGPVCEIWLTKKLAVSEGFKPTLSVKYPFTSGQLIGALHIPKSAEFTDFRGQEIAAGLYTLRYGKQPQDGNHIGTSELSDFLLALPAKMDQDPATITDFDKLARRSGESAGSTHPAIFSLLPVEEPVKTAKLVHDEDREFWILNVNADGKDSDKKVSLRLVAIGRSQE